MRRIYIVSRWRKRLGQRFPREQEKRFLRNCARLGWHRYAWRLSP
jgi:hypothetical protein